MATTRREFVRGLLASGAAIGSACGSGENVERPRPDRFYTSNQADAWGKVRGQFDIQPDVIDISALFIASHPKAVRDAIDRHRRSLDRNPARYLIDRIDENERRVLDAAARYLGARPRDIALTDSTTMGLGLVYNGINVGPGQEILTVDQNYYSTDEAIRLKSIASGAQVRGISLYQAIESVTADEIVNKLIGAIGPATKVVAVTWVSSGSGLKLPLKLISERIAEINDTRAEVERVVFCVDGVHGFGVENVVMDELGCDLFVAGTHKWLFGPRGTGIVWGSAHGWENVRPTIPTFIDDGVRDAWITGDEIRGETTGKRFSPGGFKAFEHQWAMADAFEFHLSIGKDSVAARTHELARMVKEGLAAMPHVKLFTPMSEELSAGIVCFDVDGFSPRSAVKRLSDRNIIVTVTPYADPHVRVAPSIRNSTEEIDVFLREVRGLA